MKRGFWSAISMILAVFIAWLWFDADPAPTTSFSAAPPQWVDESACKQCHLSQHEDWRGSHHHLAMQTASADTILATFEGELSSDTETSRFFRRDGDFWINTTGADGELADYRVAYMIGVEPLQQYLLELPDGRLQAHPAAWDVANARWFHLYEEEGVDHYHRLHWTKAQQNADFMCIECHTTGFERNYDAASDTHNSRWHALGVGCQACHGPASTHLQWAAGGMPENVPGKGFARDPGHGKAAEMTTCGRCHSRRAPLGNSYTHGADLLDDYLPMLLSAELFDVDGKINGEVFEYASFRQSKMHAAGVACSDCHNPHSARLRAPDNAVCTQCHNPQALPMRGDINAAGLLAKNYDDPSHHHHPEGSSGSLCISCHMPGKLYMGNDLRRDHSFSSPNPIQARALSHDDACIDCHKGSARNYLRMKFEHWYPHATSRDNGYARDLHSARNGLPGAAAGLLQQLSRRDLPDIRRATLLNELAAYPSAVAQRVVTDALMDESPLVRRTAIELLPTMLPAPDQVSVLKMMLADPVRAVRLAASWQLLQLLPGTGVDVLELRQLVAEYEQSQATMLDRADAHYNLAGVYQLTGREEMVEPALRAALQRDAAFHPARIMLAQWLEQAVNDPRAGHELLREGAGRYPHEASLHYGFGLMRVRQGAHDDALQALRRAHEHAPEDSQYAYVLAVAMHGNGQVNEALEILRNALRRDPADRNVRAALIGYLHAAGHETEAQFLLEELRMQNPGDPLLQSRSPTRQLSK